MSDPQNTVPNSNEIAKSNNPKPDPQVPSDELGQRLLKRRSLAAASDESPKVQISVLPPDEPSSGASAAATPARRMDADHDFYVLSTSSPLAVDAKLPASFVGQSYWDNPRRRSEWFDYEASTASFDGASERGRLSPLPDSKAALETRTSSTVTALAASIITSEEEKKYCLLRTLRMQRAEILRNHGAEVPISPIPRASNAAAAQPDGDLRPHPDPALRVAGEEAVKASAAATASRLGDFAALNAMAKAAWERYSRMVADMREGSGALRAEVKASSPAAVGSASEAAASASEAAASVSGTEMSESEAMARASAGLAAARAAHSKSVADALVAMRAKTQAKNAEAPCKKDDASELTTAAKSVSLRDADIIRCMTPAVARTILAGVLGLDHENAVAALSPHCRMRRSRLESIVRWLQTYIFVWTPPNASDKKDFARYRLRKGDAIRGVALKSITMVLQAIQIIDGLDENHRNLLLQSRTEWTGVCFRVDGETKPNVEREIRSLLSRRTEKTLATKAKMNPQIPSEGTPAPSGGKLMTPVPSLSG
jgi:hypothetical protein